MEKTVKDEIKGLCRKAETFLRSTQLLIEANDFDSAVSRAYYAMFYMTQACLLSQNVRNDTHAGNAQKFGELFIKTEIFPRAFGRYLSYAMEKRSRGDYDIFLEINLDVAQDLLQTAVLFKDSLKEYLEKNGYLD